MGIREDYQAKMEKQLNDWTAQTERLKTGLEQVEIHAKGQIERNFKALRDKQSEAWVHFGKMKASNEGAWEQFQAHMDKAGGEVKAAMEQMTSVFKKQN